MESFNSTVQSCIQEGSTHDDAEWREKFVLSAVTTGQARHEAREPAPCQQLRFSNNCQETRLSSLDCSLSGGKPWRPREGKTGDDEASGQQQPIGID